MTCPKCGYLMTGGAPHDPSYVAQYECHHCGYIKPIYSWNEEYK